MAKKIPVYTQITIRATDRDGKRVTLFEFADDYEMEQAADDAWTARYFSMVEMN